jgi:hypothetical protein
VTEARIRAYTNRVRAVDGPRRRAGRDPSSLGRVGATALFVALVAVSSHTAAQSAEDYRVGRQAYQNQDYETAAQRFETLVNGSDRLDPAVRIEARKYLAASYVFLNRPDDAETQFTLLLQDDPTHELDDVLFARQVVTVFRRVQNRIAEERARREREEREREAERRQREAERILRERDRVQRLEELARQMIVEERSSRWLATIPFGVGQFQNDDEGLGWFFFITESAFTATAVTTAILHAIAVQQIEQLASEFRPPEDPDVIAANDLEDISRWINIIAVGALGATMLAGILEAHASFEDVRTEVRVRELPPDLQAEPVEGEEVEPVLLDPMESPPPSRPKLSLSISPLGLTVRF